MTQEEKAKAYDETLIKGSRLWKSDIITRETYEFLFPELAEREDERIRKWLIGYFNQYIIDGMPQVFGNGLNVKDVTTWLEKQGEQKPIKLSENDKKIRSAIYRYLDWLDGKKDCAPQEEYTVRDMKIWLTDFLYPNIKAEKELVEQNHVDKVEPKFKVGDWVANDYCVGKVIELTDDAYLLDTGQGIPFSCEHDAHLWTIEDAKDGDVLLSKHNQPFIYNGIFDEESVGAYCGIDKTGNSFLEDTFSCDWSYKEGVKPTTKEQRDLLFQKMKEDGHEWDAEKKELKTIEQKPAEWKQENVEELTEFENAMMHIGGSFFGENAGLDPNDTDTIKEQAELLLELAPKTEWSEDDEEKFRDVIRLVEQGAPVQSMRDHYTNWLKSLKQRIGE